MTNPPGDDLQYWIDAHARSCHRRGSFRASVETTIRDADDGCSNREDAKRIIDRECTVLSIDGTVVSSSSDRMAFCIGECWSEEQRRALAALASRRLRPDDDDTVEVVQKEESTSSWTQYVAAPVRILSRGIYDAIDSVLGDEYSRFPTLHGAEMDDASRDAAIPMPSDRDDDDDRAAETVVVRPPPLSNADNILSIDAVVDACRCLLEYSKRLLSEEESSPTDGEFYVLRGDDDGKSVVDRILLKGGSGPGSVGSLCRRSGTYYSSVDENNTETSVARHGAAWKALSDISDENLSLLTETLLASHYATADDDDAVTLFPGGMPPTYVPRPSDAALFRIRTTRNAIRRRMTRSERDAATARKNAARLSREEGRVETARIYARRWRAATDETERCAALILNLDAAELRLRRAEDDARLVRTLEMVKTALREIRGGEDGVYAEELMSDIREEMEATDLGSWGEAGVGSEVDEDELNEEFRRLELECAEGGGSATHCGAVESTKTDVVEAVKSAMTKGERGNEEAERIPTPQKERVPLHG